MYRLFFLREHQKMPDNEGERRECLIILEKVDWQQGLLKSLATDAEVSTYIPCSLGAEPHALART